VVAGFLYLRDSPLFFFWRIHSPNYGCPTFFSFFLLLFFLAIQENKNLLNCDIIPPSPVATGAKVFFFSLVGATNAVLLFFPWNGDRCCIFLCRSCFYRFFLLKTERTSLRAVRTDGFLRVSFFPFFFPCQQEQVSWPLFRAMGIVEVFFISLFIAGGMFGMLSSRFLLFPRERTIW